MAAESRKPPLPRKAVRAMLFWPVACMLLAILMWGVLLSRLNHDEMELRAAAEKHASGLARAYAQQLMRSVEQIDQISVSLKYYWQKNDGRLNLPDQMLHGLFPRSNHIYISLFDEHGELYTSTYINGKSLNIGRNEWFLRFRETSSADMLITEPVWSPRLERTLIRFLRRLENPDGSFDGVVAVSVEPGYLATFTDEQTLGKDDFIAVGRADGQLLASKTGQGMRSVDTAFLAPLVQKSLAGVTVLDAVNFADRQPRIVAWQALKGYPLVSVAGLSEHNALAGHEQTSRDYFELATIGSVLLLAAALIGMLFSARLAWRKQQAEELRSAYHLAIDGAREGFYMVNAVRNGAGDIIDFVIEDCNERAADFVRRTKEELIGMKFSRLFSGAHGQRVLDEFRNAMETGFAEDEFRVAPESPVRVAWINRRLVRSGDGLAMTIRDISDAKQHEQALADMVNTDVLTSLPNRHWLMSALPATLERAGRSNDTVALLFIDLDDFKNINDTLGHAAGDELLRAAAARLRMVIRPSDSVVRLGGDEFTIVLDQVRSIDDVRGVAERVIDALNEPFALAGGGSYTVHGSVGISLYPQDGDDAKMLLKHSDIAMYAAKAEGKGRYQFFQRQLSDRLVMRFNKEQALRKAIETDEFVLHYQPRVDTFNGELRGLEALVRWAPLEGGLVSPLEFIPLAEETGLIVRLGELVIDKACAQLAQWKSQGLQVVPVSINVSPRQFNRGGVAALLADRMAHHRIDSELIEVEITESSMMGESDAVTRELAAIEAMGIKLLIDDFGTGYSSLSQLQHLQFDVLKIDRAFTARLCDGREGEAFFMAIVSMAHVLGMRVVAEGVETPEQLQVLQALSCNEVQGYLVSRPQPASAVPAILATRFLMPDIAVPVSAVS